MPGQGQKGRVLPPLGAEVQKLKKDAEHCQCRGTDSVGRNGMIHEFCSCSSSDDDSQTSCQRCEPQPAACCSCCTAATHNHCCSGRRDRKRRKTNRKRTSKGRRSKGHNHATTSTRRDYCSTDTPIQSEININLCHLCNGACSAHLTKPVCMDCLLGVASVPDLRSYLVHPLEQHLRNLKLGIDDRVGVNAPRASNNTSVQLTNGCASILTQLSHGGGSFLPPLSTSTATPILPPLNVANSSPAHTLPPLVNSNVPTLPRASSSSILPPLAHSSGFTLPPLNVGDSFLTGIEGLTAASNTSGGDTGTNSSPPVALPATYRPRSDRTSFDLL